HDLPGRSWLQTAFEREDPDRTILSEYHAVGSRSAAFMLRNGRWKYINYVGDSPELFDLDGDPGETCDLAHDPRHRCTLLEFERRLRNLLDPEAVDRVAKHDQALLIERFGGREKALSVGPTGATPAPI